MKLSMWMIANQISELDIKLEIREDAPAILNSARLAYATNCVHIYKEQNYIVCDGEGDRIIIYDMEITRVFELIQSVFDAQLRNMQVNRTIRRQWMRLIKCLKIQWFFLMPITKFWVGPVSMANMNWTVSGHIFVNMGIRL